jgi:hypothetical protein
MEIGGLRFEVNVGKVSDIFVLLSQKQTHMDGIGEHHSE